MFFEAQERLEEIRILFRKYDDHGERAYRKRIMCRILDLVTPDEIAKLGRIDLGILDLFYRQGKPTRHIAAVLMIREEDVPTRKTHAIRQLRDIFGAPRNDWHRLTVTRMNDTAADKAVVNAIQDQDIVAQDSSLEQDVVSPGPATPEELWQSYDATNSNNEHRSILGAIFGGLSDEQVARIPSKVADVLRLYVAGKSDEQIAQELGFAKSTVAYRKARAKDLLREISLGLTVETSTQEQDDIQDQASGEGEGQTAKQLSFDFAALWLEHASVSAYTQRRQLVSTAFAAIAPDVLAQLATREIVALTLYSRGCTDEQIAHVLECEKHAAKTARHRAIDRLKALCLGQEIKAESEIKAGSPKQQASDSPQRVDLSPKPARKRGRRRRFDESEPIENENGFEDSDDDSEESDEHRIPGVLKYRKYSAQERLDIVSAFCADRSNPKIRQKVVEAHLTTVRWIAHRCLPPFRHLTSFDDLVSLGIMGLLRAMDKFVPNADNSTTHFTGFASIYIKGAMLDGVEGETDKATELRMRQKLRGKQRKEGLTQGEQERLEELEQLIWGEFELDRQMFDDETVSLIDTIEDSRSTPEQILLETEYQDERRDRNVKLQELILAAIDELPSSRRAAVELRVVLGKGFKEIGRILKRSESRAVQLFQDGMQIVQKKVKAYGLTPFD
ncbi:sigma-70 family RNA polymerase sigma factor [Candidatus Uhrbacteria bacterium]|nr:sigma-70 family RNA polymerase sigma factor [Candidatus Uhrbacteria bacterium]